MGSVGTSNVTVEINGSAVSREDLNTPEVFNDIRRFGFSRYIVTNTGDTTRQNPNNPNAYTTLYGLSLTTDNFGKNVDLMFPNTTTTIDDAVVSKFRNESSLTVQSDKENDFLSDGLKKAGFVHVGESRPTPNTMPYHLWQKRR